MPNWNDWIPVETLKALTKHAIGNIATVLYLGVIGALVRWIVADGVLKIIMINADEFVVALVVLHLFLHFVFYLWKSAPWKNGSGHVPVLA